jgi:hypothetical protein
MAATKLSDEDVARIRAEHRRGVSGKVLAAKFWITPAYVSMIVNGRVRRGPGESAETERQHVTGA